MIIGLTGKAGAGKDTFASFVSEKEVLAYASPLKDATAFLFNFTKEQLYKDKETVDLRNFDNDFFIKNMEQRLSQTKSSLVIVTDVRFDNEAEIIRKKGGIIISIERPNSNATLHTNHSSEQGISKNLIDFTICNDGTLEEYRQKVENILVRARPYANNRV
jgi:hypothetical protein